MFGASRERTLTRQLERTGYRRMDVLEMSHAGAAVRGTRGRYLMMRLAPDDADDVAVELADPRGNDPWSIRGHEIVCLRAGSKAMGWFGFGATGAVAAHLASRLDQHLAGWELLLGLTDDLWLRLRAITGAPPEIDLQRALLRIRNTPTAAPRTELAYAHPAQYRVDTRPRDERVRVPLPEDPTSWRDRLRTAWLEAIDDGSSISIYDLGMLQRCPCVAPLRRTASPIDMLSALETSAHVEPGFMGHFPVMTLLHTDGRYAIHYCAGEGLRGQSPKGRHPRLGYQLVAEGRSPDRRQGGFGIQLTDDFEQALEDVLSVLRTAIPEPLVVVHDGPGDPELHTFQQIVIPRWQWERSSPR